MTSYSSKETLSYCDKRGNINLDVNHGCTELRKVVNKNVLLQGRNFEVGFLLCVQFLTVSTVCALWLHQKISLCKRAFKWVKVYWQLPMCLIHNQSDTSVNMKERKLEGFKNRCWDIYCYLTFWIETPSVNKLFWKDKQYKEQSFVLLCLSLLLRRAC